MGVSPETPPTTAPNDVPYPSKHHYTTNDDDRVVLRVNIDAKALANLEYTDYPGGQMVFARESSALGGLVPEQIELLPGSMYVEGQSACTGPAMLHRWQGESKFEGPWHASVGGMGCSDRAGNHRHRHPLRRQPLEEPLEQVEGMAEVKVRARM
jgi:hypothetical protein